MLPHKFGVRLHAVTYISSGFVFLVLSVSPKIVGKILNKDMAKRWKRVIGGMYNKRHLIKDYIGALPKTNNTF